MDELCPSDGVLASYLAGSLDLPARDGMERHLAACPDCLETVGCELDPAGQGAGARPRAGRRLRLWWTSLRTAAAAAVLAAAGWGSWRMLSVPSGSDPDVKGAAVPIVRAPFAWTQGAGRTVAVALPDGSILTVGERTVARLETPGSGERVRMRLAAGEVELSVAKGTGAFRVLAPGGEIAVLGTRFRARAFRVAGVPVLSVEVDEGLVELKSASGAVPVRKGQRGLSIGTDGVFAQERGGSWEVPWNDFRRLLAAGGRERGIPAGKEREARLIAATFWGGFWDAREDWRSLATEGAASDDRAALRLLVELRDGGEEIAR